MDFSMDMLGKVKCSPNGEGGFDADSYVGISGCGRSVLEAMRDLEETARSLWEDLSATPAAGLTDDALSLVAEMRSNGELVEARRREREGR